jgi:hypothetical protein
MAQVKPTPNADQLKALEDFREANGKNWKEELMTAWMNGRYPISAKGYTHLLQQVRNNFGPSWLAKY